MGFQDRDYVREKHRRQFDDMMADKGRPFTPRKHDPSLLFMVLVWLAIGAVPRIPQKKRMTSVFIAPGFALLMSRLFTNCDPARRLAK